MRDEPHLSGLGDIWLARLDPVEGREQSGVRPVLIVSGSRYNQLQPSLRIAIPLTTRDRDLPFHLRVDPPAGGVREVSFVVCEQPRTISATRLYERWGTLTEAHLDDVQTWMRAFLEY